jgi:hypothetical protein
MNPYGNLITKSISLLKLKIKLAYNSCVVTSKKKITTIKSSYVLIFYASDLFFYKGQGRL